MHDADRTPPPPSGADTTATVRILLVDDHEMVLESLRRALDDEPGLTVVGIAHGLVEALGILSDPARAIDVAVLDRRLPDGDGIELGATLRRLRPDVAVLLLTGDPTANLLEPALDAGFCGVLEKSVQLDRLIEAVRDAAAGRAVVTLADLTRLRRGEPAGAAELTAREVEILRYMAQALSYKDIAARVFLSVNTVRKHVQSILHKLGAHNKLECILIARARGLVDID